MSAAIATYRGIIRAVELLVGALLVLLATIVPVGVLFRYALNAALSWTDEVGGLLLVWITFYGSVVALDRGVHLDFDLLLSKLPPAGQRVGRAVTDLALAALLAVILVNGWTIMSRLMGQSIVSLPIPRGVFYSVMPISAALMLLVLFARWFLPGATAWDRRRALALEAGGHQPDAIEEAGLRKESSTE